MALETGGARIAPTPRDGTLAFALPPGTAEARLLSRRFVPAQTLPDSDDCRRLGVAVTALWLDGQKLPLDSLRLGAGWQPPEPGLRWTDGAGAIALAGARTLTIRPYTNGRYWLPPSSRVEARSPAYPAA